MLVPKRFHFLKEAKIYSLDFHDFTHMPKVINIFISIKNQMLGIFSKTFQDRDLSEASSHIAELNAKMQHLDGQCQEAREAESALKRQVSAWRNKCDEGRREMEYLKREATGLAAVFKMASIHFLFCVEYLRYYFRYQ